MNKIITFFGVPTDRKLNKTELKSRTKELYGFGSERLINLKVGDVVTADNQATPIQVVEISFLTSGYTILTNVAINGVSIDLGNATRPVVNKVATTCADVPATKTKKMTSNKMVSGLIDRYKSQFFPEKEEYVKIAMDGAICVPVNNEYIGVKSDGSLTSYPEEFLIDVPVFSISKPQAQVKVGDIVKIGTRYGRVNTKNEDGSLKILYFSGVTGNTHEIKDMLLGQSLVRVLVNMFSFNESNGMNPMMLLAMSDKEDFDMKSLFLMQAMSNGQGFGSNSINGFNPMMLLALSDKDGKSNDIFTTMALMQMMNGGNSLFGTSVTSPTTTNPTV